MEAKKKEEDQKRKEQQEGAKKAIKEFYAQRTEKSTKLRKLHKYIAALMGKEVRLTSSCRSSEQPPEPASGTEWQKVAHYIDLTDKGKKGEKDTTRLRCVRCYLLLITV